jgi:hypothetical protein
MGRPLIVPVLVNTVPDLNDIVTVWPALLKWSSVSVEARTAPAVATPATDARQMAAPKTRVRGERMAFAPFVKSAANKGKGAPP